MTNDVTGTLVFCNEAAEAAVPRDGWLFDVLIRP